MSRGKRRFPLTCPDAAGFFIILYSDWLYAQIIYFQIDKNRPSQRAAIGWITFVMPNCPVFYKFHFGLYILNIAPLFVTGEGEFFTHRLTVLLASNASIIFA